ncbi:TPA: phosphoenolpyruvate synthase [Candidatus Dependentiae bacterium]|nr:MAG: Phosphoenolpyruvate synthase [candidate division TM6 bacterium GW2011_GWF2_43_87]HBL98800.1 phosphoenolpyruvate synthase [Candidatus Dependentiae bacterium]
MVYVVPLADITLQDVPRFGGKNASLGQMIRDLSAQGIRVPGGFALSAEAYWHHVRSNDLLPEINRELELLEDIDDLEQLAQISQCIQNLIMSARLPKDLEEEVLAAYRELSGADSKVPCDVAVRSSATAEDLPQASFAGQQETFLHVQGEPDLLDSCLRCMASLFTERALVYRRRQGISDETVALSVGVQRMVRSDRGAAGVMFTLDPETGFKDVVTISSSYGLGEFVVQGVVDPDEFVVHKPTLEKGFRPIVRKFLGSKKQKLVYKEKSESAFSRFSEFFGAGPERLGSGSAAVYDVMQSPRAVLRAEPCLETEQNSFSLTDDEVLELARYAALIEKHYSTLADHWMPMDIEWAKDGDDKKLYILQARPETVHSQRAKEHKIVSFAFAKAPDAATRLVRGQAVGYGIVTGRARVIRDTADMSEGFELGDILVAQMTDPDWVPLLKQAAAIVTDQGGRTCHAAIVSREMGIPALIGTGDATERIVDGQMITVDCASGSLGSAYEGVFSFERTESELGEIKRPPIPILVNVGNPDQAFRTSFLPVDGVGLARLEFIIASILQVHPMVCAQPDVVTDRQMRAAIGQRLGVADPAQWSAAYVDLLAESIGTIAAAFYPRPVIVRCTDFKSNEYRDLLGGSLFEPHEENPMLGFRGAARYCSKEYAPAFELECGALMKVRSQFGLENVKILIPFVRSITEAQKVIELLAAHGLVRGEKGLEILMMVELVSNVRCLDEYALLFDGFSIGSNDLTQLILGVDRDSQMVNHLYDERNRAVKEVIEVAIKKAKALQKPMGICGQAPSDFPEFAQFLMESGISSISLVPDSVLTFFSNFSQHGV